MVAGLRAAVEAERVLEAAAAAALDRDPEHLGLAGRLAGHQAANLVGRPLGERDDGLAGRLSIVAIRQEVYRQEWVETEDPDRGCDFVTRATRLVAAMFRFNSCAAGFLLASGRRRRRKRVLFNDWLPFAIYGLFALAIPTTMIVGSFVFAQRAARARPRADDPVRVRRLAGPPQRQRFTVSFYLTAMLFILFDIEIVFLYPLAVILHQLGWFGVLRVPDLPDHPARRLRLHLAEGSARMALDGSGGSATTA